MSPAAPTERLYSVDFFAGQADGSARSARIVVPLVLRLLSPRSVVDVGCGVGTWAAEFGAEGVEDVWGVDGAHVPLDQLRIPRTHFLARDLTKPLRFDRTFDLAVCLEVAEHLPEGRANGLVSDLCDAAPCVLFSAALPSDSGVGHVNEQYLPYWIERFASHGYQAIDPIRPQILGNSAVEWWYQQNTVMFASAGHPVLAQGFQAPQTIIHPELYEIHKHKPLTLKAIARGLPEAVVNSLRFHLQRRR